MLIELPGHARKEAIASIRRYFAENFDEVGDLPASILLDYFLEEIGPLIYNKAVVDTQVHLTARIAEVDSELYIDPLQYWSRHSAGRKRRP